MLNIGKLVGFHGLRGDIKVLPSTDFPTERFALGSKVSLEHNGQLTTLTIKNAKKHKNLYLLQFAELSDREIAQQYIGGILKISVDESVSVCLERDEYHFHQLLGCSVSTSDGKALGKVAEILPLPANDVLVVRDGARELLLPFIKSVVVNIDLEAEQIIINWMEGLDT